MKETKKESNVVDGIELDENYYYFTEMVEEFSSCMDDYLYVYDVQNDIYYITSRALKRFRVQKRIFKNVIEEHKKFVHPADYDFLVRELMDIVTGAKMDHNMRYRWLGANGEPIWINCRGKVVVDDIGRPLYMIGCINEIGKKQQADNISGLLGEMSLREQLRQYVSFPLCEFLRIGIDGFKYINEIHGTEYGDWILYEMGRIIGECIEIGQDVYRVGADEFIIFDRLHKEPEEAKKLYKKIRDKVDEFIEQRGYETLFTISCGSVSSDDFEKADYYEIDKYSQFALSSAKEDGRNQIKAYDAKAYDKFKKDQELVKKLRRSIPKGFEGFELYFQPIVNAETEEVYAAEALLRYKEEDGTVVVPNMFIPQMEDSGLIVPIGRWVINEAFRIEKEIQKTRPEFIMGINLSYIQVLKSNVAKDIQDALEKFELDPKRIVVELTESGFLQSDPVVRAVWNHLHEMGVNLAIDDFGTGYSNLSDLGNLQPELIKIDREFTLRSIHDDYSRQLVYCIIDMATKMGIRTVMEGVETGEEMLDVLGLEPFAIQGYYYSMPCPYEEFRDRFLSEDDE